MVFNSVGKDRRFIKRQIFLRIGIYVYFITNQLRNHLTISN
jgi:hypothetical protein